MAAGKGQDQDSHHLRRGGRGRHRLGRRPVAGAEQDAGLAALLLGVYFVISGVVRIVSALVEPGLPGGWRVLDVFVGILLTFGGVVVVRNYGMTGQTLALLITLMVGFGWIMEGVLSLVESWRIPHSGWAIVYAVISIVAGFVVLMSPLSSAVFMIIFGGCAMVVMGITSVIRAFTFGKRKK